MLATELKNNSCKLGKWTCSAILAGSEYLKLGYLSDNSIILLIYMPKMLFLLFLFSPPVIHFTASHLF